MTEAEQAFAALAEARCEVCRRLYTAFTLDLRGLSKKSDFHSTGMCWACTRAFLKMGAARTESDSLRRKYEILLGRMSEADENESRQY